MLGFIVSASIGVFAYYKEALNTSGAATAVFLGTIVYGIAGHAAFMVLVSFFVISTLIGYFSEDLAAPEKSGFQVLANGLVATFFSILYGLYGDAIYLALFIASIGIAAADTWGGELSRRSKQKPFSLFRFRKGEKGFGGKISIKGLMATLLAGTFYTGVAFLMLGTSPYLVYIFIFTLLGNVLGNMLTVVQVKVFEGDGDASLKEPGKKPVYTRILVLENWTVNFLGNLIAILLMAATITFL